MKKYRNRKSKASTHYPETDHLNLFMAVQSEELEPERATLKHCTNASDLQKCILHAMLVWLVTFQKGVLHRDIGIHSIIKFDTQIALRELGIGDSSGTCSWYVGRLDSILRYQGRMEEACCASITDAELRIEGGNKTNRYPGSYAFKSTQYRRVSERRKSYTYSPLDDLWSFFWTAVHATLNNAFRTAEEKSLPKEVMWRKLLHGRDVSDRETVLRGITELAKGKVQNDKEYSSIVYEMAPCFLRWHNALSARETMYNFDVAAAGGVRGVFKGPKGYFRDLAFRGVADFAHISGIKNRRSG